MSLDHAHLATFAAVVEEGTFDAAARRLHVTPSAVSQRIKALESRLGQILVRRTRPCEPTEAGQTLVRLAGQIALLEREALSALVAHTDGTSGSAATASLPIAVNADSLATWFLPALAGLRQDITASFDIRQEDQDHSATLLREGTVMAAVTTEAQAVQGCRVQALGLMRYLGVASPDFLDRYLPEGPTADALAAAPMLEFNRKDALQSRFADELAGQAVDPPITYLPTSVGFVDAARLGLAWGMIPEQLGRPGLDAGWLRELAPGRTLDVPLHWQRWRIDARTLDAVTHTVVEAAASALRPA